MNRSAVLAIAAVACLAAATGCDTGPQQATHSPHWRDKAMLNPTKASKAVGGFDAHEMDLYRRGIAHIANAHQHVGSFTIEQVVEQEQSREDARAHVREKIVAEARARAERAAIARQQVEDRERHRREQEAYEAAHHDYCAEALADEKEAASGGISNRAQYNAAVKGLAANEQCSDDTSRMINEGYLLSMKGLAEHYLSEGDSRTDLHQANQLLVECQTTPGIYGTHTAASCETQEENNIHAQTNWDIDAMSDN